MSRHRTRPLKPGRLWDSDYGEYTGNPDDPRYDSRTGDEIYEEELALYRFQQEMRQARRQQEKTQ